MDKWLQKPWMIRVISLVLALLLFTAVSLNENASTSYSESTYTLNGTEQVEVMNGIPVSIELDEEDHVVSGVPETVSVTVEGSTSSIVPLIRQRSFNVFVDLTGLDPGTHEVNLQHSGISEDIEVQIEPSTTEVVIEERATEEFEVNVDYINPSQLAAGFEIGEATANPNTVKITSSRSQIEKIAAVKAYVNMKDVDSPIEAREVPVKVYDSQGNELDVRVEPEAIAASVDVENPNKEVPIEVATSGELPDGLSVQSITVEPESATVYASEEVLAQIKEVTTEEVNLSNITETTTMEVSLNLPAHIRMTDPELAKVVIELEEAEVAIWESVPMHTENLPEDELELSLDDQRIDAEDLEFPAEFDRQM